MNSIINLLVKLSGLGWMWEKTDGLKTYLAAAAIILPGLGAALAALAGLAGEVGPILGAHDAGALLAFVKALPHDQYADAMKAAWLTVGGGLAVLGLGHKLDKATDAPAPAEGDAPKAG